MNGKYHALNNNKNKSYNCFSEFVYNDKTNGINETNKNEFLYRGLCDSNENYFRIKAKN